MNEDSKDSTTPSPVKINARWGQERRLAFIDFRLRWEGRINRSDLTDFFGISVPQASLDISRYMELAPQNLQYDRSARVYLATAEFYPLQAGTQPEGYLNSLLAETEGILDPETCFIGWHPSTARVPRPGRTVAADTLAALLKAMRDGMGLKIIYQSMSRPTSSSRTISPHALAYDGLRWHVRAFCHSRNDFRDFVLGRILEVQGPDTESVGLPANEDTAWNTILTLVIAPNPNLSPGGQRAIELDYGMNNGEVELKCRQAILFYTLKRLGLLNRQTAAPPEEQQIILKNYVDIAPYLTPISRSN